MKTILTAGTHVKVELRAGFRFDGKIVYRTTGKIVRCFKNGSYGVREANGSYHVRDPRGVSLLGVK
jgi:hypothetical protein